MEHFRKAWAVILFNIVVGGFVLPGPTTEAEAASSGTGVFRGSAAPRYRPNSESDPDTVWIGHVVGPTGLPGAAGGFGPYHVGRGLNHPFQSGNANGSGFWDFDRFNAAETDSLQGWWPVALPYASVGSSSVNDRSRPFFGFDYGNQGNYVIPQGSPKRTFGVAGYWHRDPGSGAPGLPDAGAAVAGPDVEWPPLAGSFSAWCGLRGHGDLSVVDSPGLGGTGNAFNQSVLDYNGHNSGSELASGSPSGTDRNFPGYGSQWDQMLYRDVTLVDGASLPVTFKYRTNMSTGKNTATATRIGWFDRDPLKAPTANDGNFISSTDAGASAPVDSFMVYIGVPVEPVAGADNDFRCSDPTEGANGDGYFDIHDLQRRWFSEVIAIDRPYRELLTKSGTNAAQTFSTTVPNAVIQPILNAQPGTGGTIRVVFRVKTNRGFDDEDARLNGFSSGTAGAAIVDDVIINGWPAAQGDFESSSSINNLTTVTPTAAWKSTGKPPGVYFHVDDIAGLPYYDPAGEIGSPTRLCNLIGKIVLPGDHENQEKPGGRFGASDQDRQSALASPTINLMSPGPGEYNAMGIDADIAGRPEYLVSFDLHQNLYDFAQTGNGYRIGWQAFPVQQANGLKVWGDITKPAAISNSGGDSGCETFRFTSQGVVTSNANGVPDSIRCYIESISRCFTASLSAATCSPTSGIYAGAYYDNLAIAFADAVPMPSAANSTCPSVVTAGPDGNCCFDVIVRDINNNPMAGSSVVVDFGGCTVSFCPNQPPGVVISGNTAQVITNAAGVGHVCVCVTNQIASCTPSIAADGVMLCSGRVAQSCPSDTVCIPEVWKQLTTSGPSQRFATAMASDYDFENIYLFGGTNAGSYFADTWKWDGLAWGSVTPASSPSARAYHAMTYDRVRRRVVLFGGYDGSTALGDTWEYDGVIWTQVSSTGPSPRFGHGLAYDEMRARVVLFGGMGGALQGDTWEWDGTTWTQTTTTGPTPRREFSMAFDLASDLTMLYGGVDAVGQRNDMWVYGGTGWYQVTTQGATDPGVRSGHAMAFSNEGNVMVLYGGTGPGTSSTWRWNGGKWVPTFPGVGSRLSHAMAYDHFNDHMMIFGGRSAPFIPTGLGDTWEWCSPCPTVAALTDSMGNVILPANADTTAWTADESDIETTETPVSGLYPLLDTSSDTWYPNLPCDPSFGGEMDPEDFTDPWPEERDSLGMGDLTEAELADSLASWENQISYRLSQEPEPFSNGLAAAGPYSEHEFPHCPDPTLRYAFGGRDIIFIHGFRTAPVKQKMFNQNDSAFVDWVPTNGAPGYVLNPSFYGDGSNSYWKGGAVNYWQRHIDRFLKDRGYKNRYLIVSWSSNQRMEMGIQSILTQISDAMREGVGVVDPGHNDKSKFGTPSFVVVSHSTGGPITDAALTAAASVAHLDAGYIASHAKAHVAVQSAFSGSSLSTALIGASLALQASPASWGCQLVKAILGDDAADCSFIQNWAAPLEGVSVDLVPLVMQLKWRDYISATPARTVTVTGGHPSYMWPIKRLLLRGMDDGVTTTNSAVANPNPWLAWPSGYLRLGREKFAGKEIKDMGLIEGNSPFKKKRRTRGYFKDQLKDPLVNDLYFPPELESYLTRVATGCTDYLSPTGMVQPLHLSNSGGPLDPKNRYPNHFSFIESAADHFGMTPNQIDEDFNPNNEYKPSWTPYGDQSNREEVRVITDGTTMSLPYGGATDDAPLLDYSNPIVGPGLAVGESVKGKCFPKRKNRPCKVWRWKRVYHRIADWRNKLGADYAYDYLLTMKPNACRVQGPVPDVQVGPLDWLHDAFPHNQTAGLPGTAAFDTAAAMIKTGRNVAELTGTTSRFDIPGDSLVACACGTGIRLDLVFRIVPGPGNYRTVGNRATALRRRPDGGSGPGNAVTPGDGTFWGEYLASNGPFGSPGGHPGGVWDPNTWNSARMDTAETNLFPVEDQGNLPALDPCRWASVYHEADPKFTILGIVKNRCFLQNHSGPINSTNITCGEGTYPPPWTGSPASGFNANDVLGQPGRTREFTKIIPDGFLTPGAHVQYFLRKSASAAPAAFSMVPDTTRVTPQLGEGSHDCSGAPMGLGSDDGHRWQQFGILPDRWKEAAYGGQGMACMLFVDLNDGHGDERAWTVAAELIGATATAKLGVHNGWHAPNVSANPNNPTNFVSRHGGQPGTVWDMYGVRGIDEPLNGHAGSLGSRLATAATGFATGKSASIGPTPEMLRTYYRVVYILSGSSNDRLLGPLMNRSQNDVTMLQDFLATPSPAGTQPRGIFIEGDSFVESESQNGAPHTTFLNDFLGVVFRHGDYGALSGNVATSVDLAPTPAIDPQLAIYGVSSASTGNDVLEVNSSIPEAVAGSHYQGFGVNGPYVASVYKPATPTRNWVALTDGWDIKRLRSRYSLTETGRLTYLHKTLNSAIDPMCGLVGSPVDVDPTPTTLSAPASNYMRLLNNPMRGGGGDVEFGLVQRDRVRIRVYDVAGRLVRTVADTPYDAGVHRVRWNGTNTSGHRVGSGVYLVRVGFDSQRFTEIRKVIVMD